MTIKISELGDLPAVLGNTYIPLVSNVAGTLTTLKGNVTQLAQYINVDAGTHYGNIIPAANVVMSLGNVRYRWKDLWVSSGTIYIGDTSISSGAGGSLTVAAAPKVLFDTTVTANNVVPGNVWVSAGLANSAGSLSATLTYTDGGGGINNRTLTYGTEYIIVPTSGGAANLRILLTNTYLTSTLGWQGYGTLYITESYPELATTIGNAGMTSNTLSVSGNITATIITTASSANLVLDPSGTGDVVVPLGTTLWLSDTTTTTGANTGALIVSGGTSVGGALYVAGSITGPTITAFNSSISTLTANAATQADSLALLTSNAAVQAGTLAQLWSNAGVQSGTLSTITANLGLVSGQLATLTANVSYAANSLVAINTTLTGNIVPATTATYTLGSNSIRYNRLYTQGVTVGADVTFTNGGSINFSQGGGSVIDGVMPVSATGGGNTTIMVAATGGDAAMVAIPNFGNTILRNFVEVSPFVVNVGIFPDSGTLHSWNFANVGSQGVLRFPDSTTQSTAYTASLANVTISSSTATGTKGNICYDASYVYICVSTNQWIRTARGSTW